MSVVVSIHWPEISLDQYDEARAKVNWEGDEPTGGIAHVAWLADDGFRVVDVWETAEDFNQFANDRLMPVIAGEMGISSQPNVTIKPAHAVFIP
jgi:hypothetical protein